jgi:hypothetical protein
MCAESGAWNFKEADVLIKKSWVAAISSMTLLAACTQGPSLNGSAPAPSGGTASPAVASLPGGSGPVTIHCGDGKQALVKQVILGGQTASQVECVDVARTVGSRDVALLEDEPLVVAPPPPVRRVVRTLPPVRERVIVREVPAPRHEDDVVVVQDEEPRVVRTSTTNTTNTTDRDDYDPPSTTQGKKRPGEESAAIIVGSTGAGAGIGAIIGGKKGAIIGAVVGGVGGTIFDRKTRNKK